MKSEEKKIQAENNANVNAVNQSASLIEGELGEIKIHENVISNLVARATLQVPGVSRLAGSTFVDAIAGIVGSRRMQARAITVEMGDNSVIIDLKINILVGCKLPDVVQQVQREVIASVEETTGMNVAKVNVAVQDIDDQIPEDEENSDIPAADVSPINCTMPIP